MSSSTSSSEGTRARAWARLLGEVVWPTLGCLAIALLALGATSPSPPTPIVDRVEDVVVATQLERARSLREADVLLIGDSSALMGVDAVALGAALGGLRVESLALIGYTGPAAQAALTARWLDRAAPRRAPLVVWLMHPSSLALSEDALSRQPYEAWVETGAPARTDLIGALRDRCYALLLARFIAPPLPGVFGDRYGFPGDLAAAIQRGRGTVVDPHRLVLARPPAAREYTLSEAVSSRLRRAGLLLRARPELRVLVGLTPIPSAEARGHTEAAQARTIDEIVGLLGLPPRAALRTTASLPDAEFATLTHLSEQGRARYTALLAETLAAAR